MNRLDSHLGNEDWVGKLTLSYYEGTGDAKIRTIPFYENPVIVESQNPRYMNYAVVGRSSNLFGYLGADSRKFNLSFNISVPHISTHIVQNSPFGNTPPTKAQKMQEILDGKTSSTTKVGPFAFKDTFSEKEIALVQEHGAKELKSYQGVAAELDEEFSEIVKGFPKEENLQKLMSISSPLYNKDSDASNLRRKTLNYIASLIASIRSTVINNTHNPEFGPPLVRLDWGILYRDVPCVCKGYTLNVNGKAGYDKKTLLPRVLEVTMNLEEARALSSATAVAEDSLMGWEVLLGTEAKPGLTLDPGNFKPYKVTHDDG